MTDDPRDDELRDDDPRDDELRELLARTDPASALPAADPDGVARLMEDVMEHSPGSPGSPGSPESPETRTDHLRDRSRLTWLVAAAAALVILGGVALAVGTGGRGDDPVTAADAPGAIADPTDPGDPGATSGEAPTVTDLTLAGDATTGRCLPPETAPEVVAGQSLVVDGVVTSISGGIVTLDPTRFYAGDETDLVTVSEPSGDLQQLLAGVDFEEGGRYLVSATDGQVTLCGFSAPYSDDLAAVYDEAFAG